MLQVDTSKEKVPGQRWDFCWQRNTLQVPEHIKTLHCLVFTSQLALVSLLHIFSFRLTMLFSVHTVVTLSGNTEGCLFSCVRVLSTCFRRYFEYVASTETANTAQSVNIETGSFNSTQ